MRAGARPARREIRIEDVRHVLGRDADAAIPDGHDHVPVAVAARADDDARARVLHARRADGMARVGEDVDERRAKRKC